MPIYIVSFKFYLDNIQDAHTFGSSKWFIEINLFFLYFIFKIKLLIAKKLCKISLFYHQSYIKKTKTTVVFYCWVVIKIVYFNLSMFKQTQHSTTSLWRKQNQQQQKTGWNIVGSPKSFTISE